MLCGGGGRAEEGDEDEMTISGLNPLHGILAAASFRLITWRSGLFRLFIHSGFVPLGGCFVGLDSASDVHLPQRLYSACVRW